jgi:hypothetical protein
VDGVKVSIDLALQEGISHPAAKPEWMESSVINSSCSSDGISHPAA